MTAKGFFQRRRIDPLQDQSQPGIGRRVAQMQAKGFVQSAAMGANKFVHLPI